MIKVKGKRRNKYELNVDLIDAVGKVLTKHGHSKLGIGIVSEIAKVDKTVIYRHFGEFKNLLSAYIDSQDYWLKTLGEYGKYEIIDHKYFLKKLLTEQFEFIYSNKEVQQLLIWELADKSPLTKSIPMKREAMSQGLLKQYNDFFKDSGVDFNSVSALIISGIYFAILHMDKSTFCNTNITKKADKEKFVEAINWLIDIIFDAKEARSEVEKIALRAINKGMDTELISEITNLPQEIIIALEKENNI